MKLDLILLLIINTYTVLELVCCGLQFGYLVYKFAHIILLFIFIFFKIQNYKLTSYLDP